MKFKLTPPKKLTFWISVALAVLALIATFVSIPVISGIAFWVLLAGFVLLALGLVVKGL